ncbi:hypothetical protein A7985_05350 [Pseudoalteromonas luteoviolacea]|uniref:Uncharacterized protein n=1 Tax=Pseudoalteromonas luteoviolacea TaxID=43657 RepID=A0A1C0TVL5_9GAMM|nr:hypothetical protein [Pseudoalteromonas luteoviolacea]OCQ23368.1 hypothetical protein A7985_05350 [Pseudoalteromonas luteoviolacea]
MSDLGRLIDACDALTNTVENKHAQIDETLQNAIAELQNTAASLSSQLPRICVSENPFLEIDASTQLPTGLMMHDDVTAELFETIPRSPEERTSAQLQLLQSMEDDLGVSLRAHEYYDRGFNIIKLSWTQLTNSNWLAFPAYSKSGTGAYPEQVLLTYGAFVKVLSGEITGYWGEGTTLNKWHFGNGLCEVSGRFGNYFHPHPLRKSATGSVLVALPFITTGNVQNAAEWYPQTII